MKTMRILFVFLLLVTATVVVAQQKIISTQTVRSFLMIDKSPLGTNTIRFDDQVIKAVKMILEANETVVAFKFIFDFDVNYVTIIGILPGGEDLKLPVGGAYNPCPHICDIK
jgi:hypothetical protein